MIKTNKIFILFFIFYSPLLIYAQEIITQIDKQKITQIDDYLNYLEQENQDIGSISIFEKGKEIYNRDFGQINISKNNNESEKNYQIGSVTKMFTALIIWQLIEESKISINTPLNNFFPKIPNSKSIKIKHLLNHSSGLKNYAIKNDTLYEWLFTKVKEKEILNEIKRQGTSFEPGSNVSYSNSGYYILAKIIEKVEMECFKNVLKKRITNVLNLNSTKAISSEKEMDDIIKSYQRIGNKWYKMDDYYLPNLSGAGNIVSNVKDLNIFINALFDKKIISENSLKLLLPKHKEYFGYGIMWIPLYKKSLFGHGGDTRGTHSILAYDKENKISIAFSINGEKYPKNDFFGDILNIIYELPQSKPIFSNFVPNFKKYSEYVGIYKNKDFPTIMIYKKKNLDLLMMKVDGTAVKLTPIKENIFEFKPAELRIEFLSNNNECLITQNGKKFILKKE